jgi:peptidoglycan/LPS O-acetylase OafA/YrhL
MPHKPQLDGLRFLAFLAVFYFHARPGRYFWGPQGVQVFFTLSGFLITRILILGESGDLRADLRRFYIRRTLRIFPLYYAVVLGLWLSVRLDGVGWYLAYLYNVRAFLIRGWGGPVGHFWTLCVEEQFYLLYPLALLMTPPRRRLAMVGILILGAKAFQAYAHARLSIPWSTFLLSYCGEHLLWGSVAGLSELRTRPGRWEGPMALILGIGLILLTRARPEWIATPPQTPMILGAFTGFGIGSALVVFGLWRTSSPWIVGPLAWKPVAYLGRISYGLYVYHLLAIDRRWDMYIPEYYLIPEPYGTLLATIAVASASWSLFENPINRLKDRLTSRPVAPGPLLLAVDPRESRGSGG